MSQSPTSPDKSLEQDVRCFSGGLTVGVESGVTVLPLIESLPPMPVVTLHRDHLISVNFFQEKIKKICFSFSTPGRNIHLITSHTLFHCTTFSLHRGELPYLRWEEETDGNYKSL